MTASDPRRPSRRQPEAGQSPRPRRRRRPVDQPLNTRLVRGAALFVVPPLLLLAFTIGRPGPLPAPALPPAFDSSSAASLATELARDYPDREPGSAGAAGAAGWVGEKLGLYGLEARRDTWQASIPGLGKVPLSNLVTVIPGATPDAILFMAHRDNSGVGPGASDNASGTAALIELARGYGNLNTGAGRPKPQHTLIFLSSDGGAYGGFGAERFASTSPLRATVKAVVSLDALAGRALPRIELSGFAPRSPAPALVRTVDVRVASELGRQPGRPGWLTQLGNLGIPFGYGEQAPFLGRRISALRLTTAPDRNAAAELDTVDRLDRQHFAQLGKAAASILASLDGGIQLAGGTAGYVYLGSRIVRGWAIALVLVASLIPFLAGTVDLFARARRRRLPIRGAWRALRVRLGIWLWIALVIAIGALAGVFPRGSAIPPPPDSPAVSDWPILGLLLVAAGAALGWLRGRKALVPERPATADEALAGYAVALLALGAVAVATVFVNPYGLLFVLPSLYAWLWLPQARRGPNWLGDLLYGAGLAGPVLAAVVFGTQLGLGLNTPLYLVSLVTLGFVPWPTTLLLIVWAAVAAQIGALTAGRFRVQSDH